MIETSASGWWVRGRRADLIYRRDLAALRLFLAPGIGWMVVTLGWRPWSLNVRGGK